MKLVHIILLSIGFCLHHSISSGKARNRDYFPFVNLNDQHYVTNHNIEWGEEIEYRPSDVHSDRQKFPSISLPESEVYLNHKFTDGQEKTILLGVKFLDTRINELFMQDRAAWYKKAGKGEMYYFMPGHSSLDFQNHNYSQMILNAIEYTA